MEPVSPVIPGSLDLPENEIAKHQNEFETLPALILNGGTLVVTRWLMTDEELAQVIETKSIYLFIHKHPKAVIQPIDLTVAPPEIYFPDGSPAAPKSGTLEDKAISDFLDQAPDLPEPDDSIPQTQPFKCDECQEEFTDTPEGREAWLSHACRLGL